MRKELKGKGIQLSRSKIVHHHKSHMRTHMLIFEGEIAIVHIKRSLIKVVIPLNIYLKRSWS